MNTPPPETHPVPVVTLRTVYEEVIDIKENLLTSNIPDIKTQLRDHEVRIREMEKWLWRASGIAALGGAGLAQVFYSLFNR